MFRPIHVAIILLVRGLPFMKQLLSYFIIIPEQWNNKVKLKN
jgi:hypothetical protein